MAEIKDLDIESINRDSPKISSDAIRLPEYVARIYGLKDQTFIKTQNHLCLYCDLFFQNVQKVWVDPSYKEPINQAVKSVKNEHIHPFWPRFHQFVEAAKRGCHICRLFLDQLAIEEQSSLLEYERTNRQHGTIQLILSARRPRGVRIGFHLPPDMPNLAGNEIFSNLSMHETEESSCDFDKESEEQIDKCEVVWKVALSWINECTVNHQDCREQLLSFRGRPRRLISVGDHDHDVRLCLSSELESDSTYVTLSHCWGPQGVPFKLNKGNESVLHDRVPVSNLSQTFRDAIEFTRRMRILGVSYIWIDALCIIQDSEEDWQEQAFIMGEIYGNAFLNIAACSGSDGSSGLFPIDGGTSRRICTLEMGSQSCLPGHFTVCNKDILRMERKTILSRAWCVQELMLAPRVLYFGRGHAVWECNTILAEDMAPMRDMKSADGYSFSGRKFRLLKDIDIGDLGITSNTKDISRKYLEYYRLWMNVLRIYTQCALTFHTGRLIAISGVARLIHNRLGHGEVYIAGLWKNYLPFHLMWDISPGPRKDHQLFPYRAPSWSWASTEGFGVYNHLTNAEAIANCKPFIHTSAEVELSTADPFGPISSAILHVQGPVFKSFLGERDMSTAKHLCHLFVEVDGNVNQNIQFERLNEYAVHLDFDYPGTEFVPVYCLVVMNTAIENHLGGLLLIRQDDSGIPGRYIRIGVAYNLPDTVLNSARNAWRLKDPEEYEETVSGGDYRISII